MRSRNPAYDVPDAHELELAAWAQASGRHFKLVPSTRVQRRARASYWRRKARSLEAAAPALIARSSEAAAGSIVAAGGSGRSGDRGLDPSGSDPAA